MGSSSLESRKEMLQAELAELMDVKHLVEGELFQKYFATPFYQDMKKLKTAYHCESMYELKYLKGKHEGLKKLTDIVTEIDSKIKFIRNDIDKI